VPYFVVSDFRGGMSRTRLDTTAPAGTLRLLRNAHISRGGEIEKRKAFLPWRNLPAGTVGLGAAAGVVYVFGSAADVAVPAPVVYQRLAPSDGSTVVQILDTKAVAGKLYVAALCSNGVVRHFYDGVQVTVFTGQAQAEAGRILLPFNSNVYAASGSVLHRSGTDTPTDWNTATPGAAFFDMSSQAQGSERLTGLAEYQTGMAVFSRRTTQIWLFSADPAQSAKQQTLRNIGCVSPSTCVSFAGTDVFFLGDSGARSLRARDITDSPAASDIGTPIDDLVVEWLRNATPAQLEVAHALIEPVDGRYWLVLGNVVYVFSYFASAKISAWSVYDLPGAPQATAAVDRAVYTRIGDTVFLYGGESGAAYDDSEAVAELPMLDGRQIATWKQWTDIDVAAEGSWRIYATNRAGDLAGEDLVGTVDGSTFAQLATPLLGEAPGLRLRFVSEGSGPARLGAVAAHYERFAGR
jgi:hypothetical protein